MIKTPRNEGLIAAIVMMVLFAGGFFWLTRIASATSLQSSVTVASSQPGMGPVQVNGNGNIYLTIGNTTSVPITAQVNDYNGYTDFQNGTATICSMPARSVLRPA